MTPEQQEEQAAKRYFLLNAVRIGSLAGVILGIAIARSIIDLPYWLGVAIAVSSLISFYFAPRLFARHWKSKDGEGEA